MPANDSRSDRREVVVRSESEVRSTTRELYVLVSRDRKTHAGRHAARHRSPDQADTLDAWQRRDALVRLPIPLPDLLLRRIAAMLERHEQCLVDVDANVALDDSPQTANE